MDSDHYKSIKKLLFAKNIYIYIYTSIYIKNKNLTITLEICNSINYIPIFIDIYSNNY